MKELLILERSTTKLNYAEDIASGAITLEGIFTEIDTKNDNERIYEESEVLPHINELQQYVTKNKLLGELDHPKDFDISLSNVSHVIEELYYDKAKKQVRGKIRLLNTSKGKEAQALVKDGIPLHISSRAAGSVDENGKVKIKKFFTYDLVARPGFPTAELSTVNESLGFANNNNLFIYEIGSDKINENKKDDNTMPDNFVSREDFNRYSEYINKMLEGMKESSNKNDNVNVSKLIKYTETIAEKVNQLTDFSNYLAENVDKGIQFSNYLAENVDKGLQYSDYISENLNQIKEFTNYIAEELDSSIQYSEHVAERADKGIQYTNHLAEKLDESIQYSESIAEELDTAIQYSENIAEQTDNSIKFANYIAENLNSGNFSDRINENVNTKVDALITENVNYKENLSSKLDAIINEAKNQATVKTSKEYSFLTLLGEARKNEFNTLSTDKQAMIVESMNRGPIMSTIQADRIYDGCVMERKELDAFSDMPDKYKAKWNALSESRQSQIIAESKIHGKLDTAYKISNFWSTRDLRSKQIATESLNENKVASADVVTKPQNTMSDNYRQSLIDNVKSKLGRY